MKLIITALLLNAMSSTIVLANPIMDKANKIKLVEICKRYCPKATTNAETHECVEKKAKFRKSVKKSHCWEKNEIYEDLIAKVKKAKNKK